MGLEEDIANARADVAEAKALLDQAKRSKVQSEMSVLLRRLETQLANLLDKQTNSSDQTAAPPPTTTTAKQNGGQAGKPAYDVPYKNYSWDQSDKFVKFYLTGLKGVKELSSESCAFQKLTPTTVNFKVSNLEGKNHVFEILNLPHEILPEKSHFKVKTDMVTVFLAKSDEGKKWSHATAAAKAQADKKNAAMKPSESSDMSKDPSAGLMDMMKKMYDEGDDEMKRTIAKAWTEGREKQGGGMGGMPGMGGLDDL